MTVPSKNDRMNSKAYHKPQLRKLDHVSEREVIFLKFLRNQQGRCHDGDKIKVELTIDAAGISWQIIKATKL